MTLIKTIVIACIGIALGLSPLPFYTLTVLAPTLTQTLHLPLTVVMSGISIMTVVVVCGGPWVGRLTDAYGVRRVVIISNGLYGGAWMLFALNTGQSWQYLAHWFLLSVLGLGTMPTVWIKALNHLTDTHKGKSFAWALSGTGLCAIIMPRLVQQLLSMPQWNVAGFTIEAWQMAYICLGLLPIMVVVPLACWLLPSSGTHHIHQTHFDDDKNVKPSPSARSESGMTLAQAQKDPYFWLIGAAFLPIAFAVGGPIPNLMLIFKQHAIDPSVALGVMPSLGLWVIVGRLSGGWLMDRVRASWVALGMLSLPLLSVLVLQIEAEWVTPEIKVFLMVMGLGLAVGLEYDLLAYVVARYFGQAHFSEIYSSLYSAFALGAGFAAVIYAGFNQWTGSYNGILSVGAVGMALGAALLQKLKAYRY